MVLRSKEVESKTLKKILEIIEYYIQKEITDTKHAPKRTYTRNQHCILLDDLYCRIANAIEDLERYD